jgi:hypothetical protein
VAHEDGARRRAGTGHPVATPGDMARALPRIRRAVAPKHVSPGRRSDQGSVIVQPTSLAEPTWLPG